MTRPDARSVVRLALTPRWLLALVVLIAFAVVAIFLGRWQWTRTQDIIAAEQAALQRPIPVQDVFAAGGDAPPDAPTTLPVEGIGRPVTATGSYLPGLQVTVVSREHEHKAGVWIVTGLRLEDGQAVAVLRGWLPSPAAAGTQIPAGPVAVSGILQPDEVFYADAVSAEGTVAAIAHDRLAELWGTPLLPGFIVLATEQPSSAPAPIPVLPTVQTGDVPFPLQNFFYAFQWWIFAGFGLVLFVRYLWIDSRREDEASA